jgi:hypothetical protein
MDLYFIGYFPSLNTDSIICYFHKNFLPVKTIQNIRSLPIFKTDITYSLTLQQNKELCEILHKFITEKSSEYLFSEDLQRIYLMQLIHFIVKIHSNP